jgi:uncharacterized RDD family membrane protein YckC
VVSLYFVTSRSGNGISTALAMLWLLGALATFVIAPLASPRRQTLHDRIAGTIVIDGRATGGAGN